MKALLALCITLLLLSACAGAPQTPAQTVYAATGAYTVALTAAVEYKSLPSCDLPDAPKLCARREIVMQLQQADDRAYAALTSAQVAVRSMSMENSSSVALLVEMAKNAVTAFANLSRSTK